VAYLDPETLTCPSCGKTGDLIWVIGEGPNTKPGEGPAYTDVQDAGDWVLSTSGTAPRWSGMIACPDCKNPVLSRP
jgi:hypothetical protein